MTRKLPFWIVFVSVCAAALAFAIPNFSKSFAVISLDLRMDRAGALAAARKLAAQHHLGPGGNAREAAAFALDDTVKTFVELEGGGAAAFRAMLHDHLYDAYTWNVRLFRQGEVREATIRFRPDGTPCGFAEELREDEPGAHLTADSARVIAEIGAARDWGVDLAHYAPTPAATIQRPGGRADHTFTYQRDDLKVGAGAYRLRLVVSGDRLTEVTPYVLVPEAFSRTYAKMRSSNTTITVVAFAAMAVLYLVGGCVIGLLLLMRKRWVVWGPAVAWGFAISGLGALAQLNQLPLEWMGYDTAVSSGTFLLKQVMGALLVFVLDGCLVALSLAAAESLGRKAFPHHPQFWKLWSGDAAPSRAVVGRTVGGTVLTGFEFGYIIVFYLVATRLWKWWTPAESLVDPNELAHYVPWLSAVANSMHAGVWEEAMFRAVPLAGAALLGERFGNRKLWIGAGLVVEALVFGGGHASYASWPAYSRPVELIVPALIWGFIYLRFGLLPSIITHYLFDLSLFALPLFASTAAGSRIDQAAVVLFAAVPLGVVLVAVLRRRGMVELPGELRNGAWTVPPEEPEYEPPVAAEAPARAWSAARTRLLVGLGLAGLVAWAALGQWTLDAPALHQRRHEALETGLTALRERGYTPADWKQLVTADDDGIQSEFTWRALGTQAYRDLIGKYLVPPHWEIRLARFSSTVTVPAKRATARDSGTAMGALPGVAASSDLAERAEEWHAWVDGDGSVWRLRHVLPDARAGGTLDEAAARTLAEGELRARFHADPAAMIERSAVPVKHPARLDWTFTYADTTPHRLPQGGERRIAVEIAGDRVSDAYKFVFVPENWQRTYRSTAAQLGVLSTVRALFNVAIIVLAAALGIVMWSRNAFPVRFAVSYFAVSVVVGVLSAINGWPRFEARLSTAEPLAMQIGILLIGMTLGILFLNAIMALVAGWAIGDLPRRPGRVPLAAALALGVLASGLLTALAHLSRGSGPLLADFWTAQARIPALDSALTAATALLTRAAVLLALFAFARRLRPIGPYGLLASALLFVVGGICAMQGSAESVASWLAMAALTGAGLVALERLGLGNEPRLIPGLFAAMGILAAARSIVRAGQPDAMSGGIIEIAGVVLVAMWWLRELNRAGAATPSSAAAPASAAGT